MIKVMAAGILTSIQDMGRFGYRRMGVPLSGAMDQYMSRLANELVGNDSAAAVLEMTMVGPVLAFDGETTVAITGAGFTPTINNVEVPLNTKLRVEKGDVIKFGLAAYGLRGYLSIAGGFGSEVVLGSRSMHGSISCKASLQKGDVLQVQANTRSNSKTTSSVKVNQEHFKGTEIEVYKGPEFDLFPEEIQQNLSSVIMTISEKSNRMAYLLSGLEHLSIGEIISAPVQPGTVQLTPSGQCVVLMRDAQTTGGYARVLQLSEAGINRLAQKRTGDVVTFRTSYLP